MRPWVFLFSAALGSASGLRCWRWEGPEAPNDPADQPGGDGGAPGGLQAATLRQAHAREKPPDAKVVECEGDLCCCFRREGRGKVTYGAEEDCPESRPTEEPGNGEDPQDPPDTENQNQDAAASTVGGKKNHGSAPATGGVTGGGPNQEVPQEKEKEKEEEEEEEEEKFIPCRKDLCNAPEGSEQLDLQCPQGRLAKEAKVPVLKWERGGKTKARLVTTVPCFAWAAGWEACCVTDLADGSLSCRQHCNRQGCRAHLAADPKDASRDVAAQCLEAQLQDESEKLFCHEKPCGLPAKPSSDVLECYAGESGEEAKAELFRVNCRPLADDDVKPCCTKHEASEERWVHRCVQRCRGGERSEVGACWSARGDKPPCNAAPPPAPAIKCPEGEVSVGAQDASGLPSVDCAATRARWEPCCLAGIPHLPHGDLAKQVVRLMCVGNCNRVGQRWGAAVPSPRPGETWAEGEPPVRCHSNDCTTDDKQSKCFVGRRQEDGPNLRLALPCTGLGDRPCCLTRRWEDQGELMSSYECRQNCLHGGAVAEREVKRSIITRRLEKCTNSKCNAHVADAVPQCYVTRAPAEGAEERGEPYYKAFGRASFLPHETAFQFHRHNCCLKVEDLELSVMRADVDESGLCVGLSPWRQKYRGWSYKMMKGSTHGAYGLHKLIVCQGHLCNSDAPKPAALPLAPLLAPPLLLALLP